MGKNVSVPPSVAGGNPDQTSQLQPCMSVPEGAKPSSPPLSFPLFQREPMPLAMKWSLFLQMILILKQPTMVRPNTMICLAHLILNNMGEANGIRNRIVTFLMNAFGQHTHAFNKVPLTQNKKYYESN